MISLSSSSCCRMPVRCHLNIVQMFQLLKQYFSWKIFLPFWIIGCLTSWTSNSTSHLIRNKDSSWVDTQQCFARRVHLELPCLAVCPHGSHGSCGPWSRWHYSRPSSRWGTPRECGGGYRTPASPRGQSSSLTSYPSLTLNRSAVPRRIYPYWWLSPDSYWWQLCESIRKP